MSLVMLAISVAVLVHGLFTARPVAAAPLGPPAPPEPLDAHDAGQNLLQALESAGVVAKPEITVELPVSVVEEIYQQLVRLDVLERREQMRLVRRAKRQRAEARRRW